MDRVAILRKKRLGGMGHGVQTAGDAHPDRQAVGQRRVIDHHPGRISGHRIAVFTPASVWPKIGVTSKPA